MTLRILTGGNKELGYAKPDYDHEFSEDIQRGYEEHRMKKKKKRVFWTITFIIGLIVLSYLSFRNGSLEIFRSRVG